MAINLIWGGLTIPAATAVNAAAAGAERQLAAAGSRSVVALTYGEDRIGALVLNVLPAGAGSTMLLAQCLWGFAGDSVADVLLNNAALPAGSAVTHYTGGQTTADAALVAAFAAQGITYTEALTGFMYSVVAMPIRAFSGQLDLSARVRGRKVYDPRRNRYANVGFRGAAVGSPGTAPADVSFPVSPFGLARQIVGLGIEDDVPYVDVRYHGTASGAGTVYLLGGTTSSMAGAPGQALGAACHVRLVDGSTAGIAGGAVLVGVQAQDAGLAYVGGIAAVSAAPGTGPLRDCRIVASAGTAPAGTAFLLMHCGSFTLVSGAAVDMTLRIGMPTVYAAGSDPIAWSDNPSLALANFVVSATYGLGRAVDWASVPAAANANDALVGTPAEKRRVVGVSFISAAGANNVAEALRAYASCFLLPGADGITLRADAADATVATYSHAAGEISSVENLAKRDLGNMPTAVEVIYTDTTQVPWRDASVTAPLPGAGTTLPWRVSQVRLPGVHRHSQANREAIERLNKLTLSDLSCALNVFDIGIRHQLGDIVEVTHPLGLEGKPMRVGGLEMPGPGRWRLLLAEHDAAAYSTVVVTAPSTPDIGRAITTYRSGNLLDAGNWVLGSSGNQLGDGRTQWWALNPSAGGVNYMQLGVVPDGSQGIVWVAASGSGYGAEGGIISTSPVAIDNTRPYRVSCWIYFTGPGDGSVYIGPGPSEVDSVPAGTQDANPYFHALSRAGFVANRWHLFTGFVLPAGYGGAQLNQGGVYDSVTGQLVAAGADFRWHAGQLTFTMRAYQFYTVGAGRYTAFYRPRFEVLDGSEPSVAVLLAEAVRARANAAFATAEAAQATADGKIDSFYSPSPPIAASEGDLWFDTDDGRRQYRFTSGAWVLAGDTRIGDAIDAAADAQATADGKILSYIAPSPPISGLADGDLWFDTDDGYKQYRYTSGAWVPVRDAGIAAAAAAAAAANDELDNVPSVTIPSGDLSVAVSNGVASYGSRAASASGGTTPYSYRWAITYTLLGNSGPYVRLINDATATVTVSGKATNSENFAAVACTVTDARGRTATARISVTAVHGTPT